MEAAEIEKTVYPEPISWKQLIFLFLLGISAVFIPSVVSLICWASVLLTLYVLVNGKVEWLWYGIAASPMLEVWGRMVKAPLVPYEAGKYYLLLCLVILSIYHIKHKTEYPAHRPGFPLLLLLFPSAIVAISAFDREQWVFNVLPIIELGLLLLFAARERWTIDQYGKTIRFGLLPIIPILIYLTLRSPSINELNFVLSANAEATGGFGSNQVSTILGSAIVLTFVLIILNYPILPVQWFSYLLLGYMILRGLLTFSRGGMLGALFSIIISMVPIMFSGLSAFLRGAILIIGFSIIGYGAFFVVNNITGNKLLQRYQGETEGTISGKREKTLNLVTSGRVDIAAADLEIFKKNILFGVGPGGAKELRGKYGAIENSAAHTEFSRLLSEHGLGGLFIIIILTIFPFLWIRNQKFRQWKIVITALFILAIFTCLHSAMRTNTTVVYYTLAAIPVMIDKYWYAKFKKTG